MENHTYHSPESYQSSVGPTRADGLDDWAAGGFRAGWEGSKNDDCFSDAPAVADPDETVAGLL